MVAGGILGGVLQYVLWGAAIVLDILFAGGTGLAIFRATHRLPVFRSAAIVVTAAAIVALPGIAGYWSLAVGLVGILAIAIVEHRQ